MAIESQPIETLRIVEFNPANVPAAVHALLWPSLRVDRTYTQGLENLTDGEERLSTYLKAIKDAYPLANAGPLANFEERISFLSRQVHTDYHPALESLGRVVPINPQDRQAGIKFAILSAFFSLALGEQLTTFQADNVDTDGLKHMINASLLEPYLKTAESYYYSYATVPDEVRPLVTTISEVAGRALRNAVLYTPSLHVPEQHIGDTLYDLMSGNGFAYAPYDLIKARREIMRALTESTHLFDPGSIAVAPELIDLMGEK